MKLQNAPEVLESGKNSNCFHFIKIIDMKRKGVQAWHRKSLTSLTCSASLSWEFSCGNTAAFWAGLCVFGAAAAVAAATAKPGGLVAIGDKDLLVAGEVLFVCTGYGEGGVVPGMAAGAMDEVGGSGFAARRWELWAGSADGRVRVTVCPRNTLVTDELRIPYSVYTTAEHNVDFNLIANIHLHFYKERI